jgi:hypothetical protein
MVTSSRPRTRRLGLSITSAMITALSEKDLRQCVRRELKQRPRQSAGSRLLLDLPRHLQAYAVRKRPSITMYSKAYCCSYSPREPFP